MSHFPREKPIEQSAKKPRNPRIEALRLVAIVAIAVFHTFQPWFSAATDAASDWAQALPWLTSPASLTVLGLINLLGAYGNHVFYLISGYFLLPAAIKNKARRTGRKVAVILVSVAFYAALTLLLAATVPMEGISLHEFDWLVAGLEFIWVYLALVLATPLMALVARRLPHWRHVVIVMAVLVFALNGYVAFFSPGEAERGLLEWRKLMSAVSYLVAYLTGGAMAGARLSAKRGKHLLAAAVGTSVAVEALLAAAGRADLVAATSFKSTSVLSYALAVASLANAVSEQADKRQTPKWVLVAASSILGFYISQSMTSSLWRPAFEQLCGQAAIANGLAALLVAGILASMVMVAATIAFDQLTRTRLLRLLKLA